MDAGAVGITCQKVSEAEVMADAGFTDIFIPYNIVGEAKLNRLMALAARVTVSVTADSATVCTGLSKAARQTGLMLIVLIECDTGAKQSLAGYITVIPVQLILTDPHRFASEPDEQG